MRKTPYTERGIRRVPCTRCGQPSRFQWNACADGNTWRGVCAECDIKLNEMALTFMRVPDADAKIAAYRLRVGASS